jgi:hypothetical protein
MTIPTYCGKPMHALDDAWPFELRADWLQGEIIACKSIRGIFRAVQWRVRSIVVSTEPLYFMLLTPRGNQEHCAERVDGVWSFYTL